MLLNGCVPDTSSNKLTKPKMSLLIISNIGWVFYSYSAIHWALCKATPTLS